MRKLPPSIPEEDVRQLVESASGGRFSWFNFVQGKTRCSLLSHNGGVNAECTHHVAALVTCLCMLLEVYAVCASTAAIW